MFKSPQTPNINPYYSTYKLALFVCTVHCSGRPVHLSWRKHCQEHTKHVWGEYGSCFPLFSCFRSDTFTPMLPISLSVSSQLHFPLFSCYCGFCLTFSLPSSLEPFLLALAIISKFTVFYSLLFTLQYPDVTRTLYIKLINTKSNSLVHACMIIMVDGLLLC